MVEKQPILVVKDLKQYFKMSRKYTVKAVDGISFEINPGETYGLVGESGSGKSTLLNMIGALDTPTSGNVIIDGKNIFTVPMAFVMVGYTFVLMVLLAFNQKQKAGSGAAGIMRREYERCYAAIREGRAPAELEIQTAAYTGKLMDLPVYKKYLLMLYYHFLDQGDYDSLRNVMDEMEDHVPDKWSRAEMSSLCEFVFYNVIIQPNEGKAHFYGKTFLAKMEGNEEANTKRVFAYWLYFVKKDKGAALQIAMEAMKAVESYALTGCRDMEMRFIQALVKRIEQTPS